MEVRIADDGEVLVRGPLVMGGYYKDPELTMATIDADGWLHTGDIGELDADGFLKIIDRKKELIITSGGKNISPALVEYELQRHPLIGQACAIGDRRNYVTALLVLDPETTPAWARAQGIAFDSLADLAAHPEVLAEVERGVAEANSHLARPEQVRRFTLLPAEWTAQSGELTPSMKRRRRVIIDRYAKEIEELYVLSPYHGLGDRTSAQALQLARTADRGLHAVRRCRGPVQLWADRLLLPAPGQHAAVRVRRHAAPRAALEGHPGPARRQHHRRRATRSPTPTPARTSSRSPRRRSAGPSTEIAEFYTQDLLRRHWPRSTCSPPTCTRGPASTSSR